MQVKKCGEVTVSVVYRTNYLTANLVNVIQMGGARVVMVCVMENVVTRQRTVLVSTVLTTGSSIKSGENQGESKGGGTTGSVVVTTAYLTVVSLAVILTGRTRVVVTRGMESVVTRLNTALVQSAQTTSSLSGG